MLQTTKEALWQAQLARFLLSQHITPDSSTGKSPAELLMNQRLTTASDCLHPDHEGDMIHKQELSAVKCPGTVREFRPSDLVYMRSYARDSKWTPGLVGAGAMSESLPSRRYPVRKHRAPRRLLDFVDWGKGV